jgi:outer membrane protein OmpA-like peptidoglycan-associated protein
MLAHSWMKFFINDLSKGYNAPAIREIERKSFVFQPIYFDYDKAEIRPEYHDFLIKMIRVVDGHTDLRIKVTGHTDADGSDAYNVDLSKKRAQALIDFFVANGLSKDRIEIDFKGESLPVDSNSTPEGKQHNRRVDFAFI